jgi:hypothetical protein
MKSSFIFFDILKRPSGPVREIISAYPINTSIIADFQPLIYSKQHTSKPGLKKLWTDIAQMY